MKPILLPFRTPVLNDFVDYTPGIITRAAVKNEVMKQIHNTKPDDPRMVMFLPDKMNEEHWLIPDMSDAQMNEVFDYELPSQMMDYHSFLQSLVVASGRMVKVKLTNGPVYHIAPGFFITV